MSQSMILMSMALLLPAQAPAPRYVLQVKPAQRVEAVLTYTPTYPNLTAAEWIAFVPVAPELTGQVEVKTRMEPKGKALEELSLLHRPLLLARVPVKGKELLQSLPLKVTYEATLRSRHLRPLNNGEKAPKVAALSAKEEKAALAEFGDFNFRSAAVQEWIKKEALRRGPDESDVDFARRVFTRIRTQFTYAFELGMDRHASAVCAARKSDCGGLCALFVAVMRSEGVPARSLFGRWAKSAKKGDDLNGSPYYQWHVKGEFFAQGVGWTPADLSSAILHDKSKTGLAYFGHDAGDFLTQHVDSHLLVDTIHFGKRDLHNLQRPAVWVSGAGNLRNERIVEDWQVRKVMK